MGAGGPAVQREKCGRAQLQLGRLSNRDRLVARLVVTLQGQVAVALGRVQSVRRRRRQGRHGVIRVGGQERRG